MKHLTVLYLFLSAVGCGYSSLQNQVTGQVKAVVRQNPIFCENRVDVDLSLGVLRNGVGSMSTQDIDLTVLNSEDVTILAKASETGTLVKITFDDKRWTWCWNEKIITKVELIK